MRDVAEEDGGDDVGAERAEQSSAQQDGLARDDLHDPLADAVARREGEGRGLGELVGENERVGEQVVGEDREGGERGRVEPTRAFGPAAEGEDELRGEEKAESPDRDRIDPPRRLGGSEDVDARGEDDAVEDDAASSATSTLAAHVNVSQLAAGQSQRKTSTNTS